MIALLLLEIPRLITAIAVVSNGTAYGEQEHENADDCQSAH